MDLSAGFLVYAAVFRLSVIAVGCVAIVLGYLLFVRGTVARGRTEAGLEIAEFKLNLRNAAPGTCFAVFGVAVIVAMLVGGNPALTLEQAQSAASADLPVTRIQVKGRGNTQLSLKAANGLEEAQRRLREDDYTGAMAAYSVVLESPGLSLAEAALALEPMARIALARGDVEQAETFARLSVLFSGKAPAPLNTLARTLLAGHQPSEALAAARGAVAAAPEEPRYLHTLAISLAESGDHEEAKRTLDQAVRLDPAYAAERRRVMGEGQ